MSFKLLERDEKKGSFGKKSNRHENKFREVNHHGLLTLSLNTNTKNVPTALWFFLQLQTVIQKLTKLNPKSELVFGLVLSTEDETRLISAHIRRVQPTRCNVSQFIYFCKTLYMFQSGFPSIIRSSKLHIQRQVLVRPISDAVCAVLSS